MAKMISLIKFSGGLDDMIGYRVKGQIRLRRKPDKVKQTLATKRAAKDFGSASRTSAILRHGIAKEITHYHDDSFLNRLNTAMIGVVKSDIVRPAGRRQVTTGNLHAPGRISDQPVPRYPVWLQRTTTA
ncbi:hypothetical protein MKQ70_11440 [Chitinophaga sedimenti]|uniref:hypothetical protein n=1 Tax=Chitinophaga sedimenti TaxID=2033606 RepID=UPI002006B3BC|nr:hypothetical protein [Chitinophaga sedimenti]MCK7555591.1 hypothetical protein [Chitinophaga sedimenti]